jgi:predicted HicB family RNase H-like nuclease
MMNHKGYLGLARVDIDAGVIRGRVINTRDTITFQGKTVAEAETAFRDSVDDYLEFCAERGETPDKPYSGHFPVRTSAGVHRLLSLEASRRGISLNALVGSILKREALRASRKSNTSSTAPPPRTIDAAEPSQAKAPKKTKVSR